jgi:hypothetical protein
MKAEGDHLMEDGSPLKRRNSFPEEFSNINEMLTLLEQRKSLNEANSLKNAGSIEYSVQEQIEEENSDPEEDEESEFEREARTNDMSPKKRHYSRGDYSHGSSSAEAKSSS